MTARTRRFAATPLALVLAVLVPLVAASCGSDSFVLEDPGVGTVAVSSVPVPVTEPEDSIDTVPMVTPGSRLPDGRPVKNDGEIDPEMGVTTKPVTPITPITRSLFEDLDVFSSIPEHPAGLVYLFHGEARSASFVNRVETLDVVNELLSRGYGIVSTDSTDRTNRTWNVDDVSITSNPDLARVERLHKFLLETTPIDQGTVLFGLGMDDGSAFATVWGEAFAVTNYPVRAIAKYMTGVPESVANGRGVTLPMFMVLDSSDTRQNKAAKADMARARGVGLKAQLFETVKRPLLAARFLRISGVGKEEADGIIKALLDARIIDSAGKLQVDESNVNALLADLAIPKTVKKFQSLIVAEIRCAFGMREMTAQFKVENADFFDKLR